MESKMNLKSKGYRKIIVYVLISVILATILIVLMDYDLLSSLYNLYFGESEIADFFENMGQNVFKDTVRITSFKLVIYRAIYSAVPVIISIFLLCYYRAKALPRRILNLPVFEKNPSLASILQFGRYALGIGLAFIILTFKKAYYYTVFHNCLLGYMPDYFRLIIACCVFLIITIDFKRLWSDLKTFPYRHRYITIGAFILFISVLSFCIMEFQIGSKTQVFVYLLHINIGYWLLFQLLLLGITRRPKIGAVASLLLAYAIGLSNDIVYQFRGNYIMFGDLTVVRTALEVAGNYDYRPGIWFWISLGLLILSVALVVWVKLPTKSYLLKRKIGKKKTEGDLDDGLDHEDAEATILSEERGKLKIKRILIRIGTTFIIETLLIVFIMISFRNGSFYGHVFGVGWDYNENVTVVGYLPYFFSNMDANVRVEVEGYSAEKAKEILEQEKQKVENEPEIKSATKEPNIIVVQNEAFADLRITADIETDIDPMPYIHSMKENTQKGYMNMSVTGGPTSNTEFEVLARSSLQYLPYGSVPYTQYVKRDIPSLPRMLRAQTKPYHTVAYHSYYASGYNRNSVYDYMGFDQKVFEDHFLEEYPESDLPRGYLSDEANYKKVIKLYEKNKKTNEPFFCFNVTIQGHGGYTGGPYDLGEKVNVTNFEATESIRTYLSSVKVSDTAFKGLIDYYSKVDEPTIIFMYGDHQPAFDDEAKEILAEHPAWKNEMNQMVSQYYVPYVIWANFDIDEFDGLIPWGVKAEETDKWDVSFMNKLSTNYAGSYLMKLAGLQLSVYDEYLLDVHKEIPAMTAIGVWDKAGNYYGSAAESPDADHLHDLEIVQYNLIFDDEKPLTEYYLPKDD